MQLNGVLAVTLSGSAGHRFSVLGKFLSRLTAQMALLFLVSVASRQTASSPMGTELVPVTVQGLVPNNILPTSTDFSDAFGLDLPVTDVPRSISVITKEELQNANIQTARSQLPQR
jgi:outer membrane receptor for ferric coprogen and ferric-rhodotorulic acid